MRLLAIGSAWGLSAIDGPTANGCRRRAAPIFLKEDIMFEVTSAATEQIAAYFSDKEVRPVRIFLNEGG